MIDVYTKQPKIVDKALEFIPNDRRRTVLQAGAHVGNWPRRLSETFHTVVSFEPKPESWRASMDVVRERTNVLLINGALGSEVSFSKIDGKPYDGSARLSDHGVHVSVYTIDGLPGILLKHLDAVFLDVEGYELQILRGAQRTLARLRPWLILEERGKWDKAELQALLPAGYSEIGAFHGDLILKP